SSCIPGFDVGAFGINSVGFTGNGTTDGYDSALGYAASHTGAGGNVCTNATTTSAISLSGNAAVGGNACVGAGGDPNADIRPSGNASVASRSAQAINTVFPSVAIPTVGANQGNASSGTLAPNQTYGTVSCSGNNKLALTAGTYVMSSLSISGNCSLTVGS